MKVVIPMAGLGSRFSKTHEEPKPLIKIHNKSLIRHSVESLDIDCGYIFITREYDDFSYNEKLSKELAQLGVDFNEVRIKSLTSGAAETSLYAEDYIDPEEELVITNCDQFLLWDSGDFLNFCRSDVSEGCVLSYNSSDPKNSFIQLNNEKVVSLVEKNPISNHALVGVHYWSKSKYFFDSAKKLIKKRNNKKESYISETYNFMISDGKSVGYYKINSNNYIPLGTPSDLLKANGIMSEYFTNSPSTIFIDLDGTILKHSHRYSLIHTGPKLLDGVREKLDYWDSIGHTIVLVTARKESARKQTEEDLRSLMVPYDQLIMGVSSGNRYLINDKLNESSNDRAISINVITDSGLKGVDIK